MNLPHAFPQRPFALARQSAVASVASALSLGTPTDAAAAYGTTKATVRLICNLQVDLRVVEDDSYGAALQYLTGSKAHNIHVRQRAIERGWQLSEYGLGTESEKIACTTEADIFCGNKSVALVNRLADQAWWQAVASVMNVTHRTKLSV